MSNLPSHGNWNAKKRRAEVLRKAASLYLRLGYKDSLSVCESKVIGYGGFWWNVKQEIIKIHDATK